MYFSYTGRTALTIRGSATGTTYVFAHPGAILAVDPRDGRSLVSHPKLSLARPL